MMIDGEIYIKEETESMFAWRQTDGYENMEQGEELYSIFHYVCINSTGCIHVFGDGFSCGCIGSGKCRRATNDEINQFYAKLHARGLHYNKLNKKIINITTGLLYG